MRLYTKNMNIMRQHLEASFRHALEATHPARLVRENLPGEHPALILALGKAALPMLKGALEIYPDVPYLATPAVRGETIPGNGEILPGIHPVPNKSSVKAAERALDLASQLKPDNLLLVLVSGGGSALWCAPWGISLEEKQALTEGLLRSGASIQEMNAVRKHVSRIKGGRLAAATKARAKALLLSDVTGDDMAVIASGPTVPDPTTFADAIGVLDRYRLDFPQVRKHLQRGIRGELPESPKPADPVFARVENKIIGSNQILLEAARTYWQGQGYNAVILSDRFAGEAKELARFHAALVGSIRAHQTPFKPPVVLLSGGEATVTVRGRGKGGRNQEFALWLLDFLRGQAVWALSAGSDGIDGNSSAAGAFLSPDSWERAKAQGLEVNPYLEANDSNSFFKALGDTLETGPTQHNLNDFRCILVD